MNMKKNTINKAYNYLELQKASFGMLLNVNNLCTKRSNVRFIYF